MSSAIELKDVYKTYAEGAGVRALAGVSVNLVRGQFLGVVGASGSGKSTLLHMMGLLDRPTSGSVLFEGRDTSRLSDRDLSGLRSSHIGFVFQSFHLIQHLSVLENVELPLFYQGVKRRERRERSRSLLAEVNMSHRESHLPSKLSGGERQRTAIARALVTEPNVILADEPTGNLDSKSGEEILDIFYRLHEGGKTLAIITHDMSIARKLPSVVAFKDGRVQEDMPA